MEKLVPCPYCGGSPHSFRMLRMGGRHTEYHIECDCKNAMVYGFSEEEAELIWNKKYGKGDNCGSKESNQ